MRWDNLPTVCLCMACSFLFITVLSGNCSLVFKGSEINFFHTSCVFSHSMYHMSAIIKKRLQWKESHTLPPSPPPPLQLMTRQSNTMFFPLPAPLVDSGAGHSSSAMLMLLSVVFVGLAVFLIYKFKRYVDTPLEKHEDSKKGWLNKAGKHTAGKRSLYVSV